MTTHLLPKSLQELPPVILLREVAALARVNEASIRNWARNGTFPPPLRLGRGKCLRWNTQEVLNFLHRREANDRAATEA